LSTIKRTSLGEELPYISSLILSIDCEDEIPWMNLRLLVSDVDIDIDAIIAKGKKLPRRPGLNSKEPV
jgi:hypothetical protein